MYAGLTIADKGALLDAKASGAEWVARDEDGQICEYQYKPVKFISKIRRQGWWSRYGVPHSLMFDGEVLQFVKWSDAEPVNIDTALAQIAEMEREQKPLGCHVCNNESNMIIATELGHNFCYNCGRNLNSLHDGRAQEGAEQP